MQVQTNKSWAITFLILIQLFIGFGGAAGLTAWSAVGKLPAGINVAGVDVGRLSREEAVSTLTAFFNHALPTLEMELVAADGKRWSFRPSELNTTIDVESTVDAAWQTGWQKNWLSSALTQTELLYQPKQVPLRIDYDIDRLQQMLAQAEQYFFHPPKNAHATILNDKIEINSEGTGSSLDLDATRRIIQDRLAVGDFSPVKVVEKSIKPQVTRAELIGITDLLGIFVTRFNVNEKERAANIKLATEQLDGSVLSPGKIFSFNQQIGPRLPEKGYQKAPVIWDGQVALTEGGGVCQVATTLYNAVLQSNLEIQQRFPHSEPVNYVPLGHDATIAGDEMDLKFINSTNKPIFISAVVEEDKLIIRIFGGNKDKDQQIKILTEEEVIEPKVIVNIDQKLNSGAMQVKTEGKPGYEVKVYRVVEKYGQEVARNLISTDVYPAKPTIVVVGPRSTTHAK